MSSDASRLTATGHRGPGRPPRSVTNFPFKTGDLVLVKWNDGMVYFAKIKRIDQKRCKCVVVFDDKSQDEAHFSQIHSVDETTTDIICIKCKKDASFSPNEIVLCDTCGIGFHQKCHNPQIPASALELDTPWNCTYCLRGTKCPFLTESLNALQNLLSDDNDSNAEEEAEVMPTIDSDVYEDPSEEGARSHSVATHRKKRGRKRAERATRKVAVDRRTIRGASSFQSSRTDKRPSPMNTPEAWKHKLASTEISKSRGEIESSPAAIDSDATYSPGSTPEPSSGPALGFKRKKTHISISYRHKRQKRSSVEARTVSVTRFTGPISTDDSSTSTDHDPPSRDSTFSEENFRATTSPIAMETQKVSTETRPRSLRVSLTFPEEVEPGTPLDKVIKLASPPHLSYTKPNPVLPWEDASKSSSPMLIQRSPVHVSTPSHKPDTKSSNLMTPSPFDDVGLKPKKRKVSLSNNGTDVAFKASPLPRSTSTSPQNQLVDEVFSADQSETVSMAVKLDVGVTGPAVSRPAAVSRGTQPKLIDNEPKPILSVASAVTQVTGKQQNQQLKVASSSSPLIVSPQVIKPTDGVDSEKHRPVILTTTTNLQTPVQHGGSFEVKSIATRTPGHNAILDTQPRKVSPPVLEPHISLSAFSTVRTETDSAAAGNPILPTPQPQASKEKSVNPPISENDVIITGVENVRALLQGNVSSTISPVQAQMMVVDGHRRAHELSEITKGRQVATIVQKPKTVVAKTVDIQSPVTSQAQGAGSVIMPVPNQTPVVPVIVTPTPPATQYKVSATSQHNEIQGTSAETPTQQLQGKGIQTLYCRVQDQNGQQVYIPIAATTPQQPPSQPLHVILTKEATSQVDSSPNVTTTPVGYPTPESTVSLPVQQTQPRVYYTSVPQPSVPQPSVPSNGKVASAVSGVSTTKPYAIVNALPVSSVEHTQVTRPQHHNMHPSLATKVISSPTNFVAVDTPKSASQTYESVSKQNDTIFVHRAHTVLTHTASQSNTTPKIVSRTIDKEDISTISKKVGDALSSMNPEMLMSAFEDAWSKFQANERFYKTQRKRTSVPVQSTTKQRPPPNVEVLPSSSRSVSLIRQMGTRPRMIAPKPYSRSVASTPPATIPIASSTAPTTPSTEYAIYSSIPQGSSQQQQQQQVVLHPVYTLPATAQQQKTYQVQTAGLFYPASVAGGINSSQQDTQQQVTVLQPAPRQAKALQTNPRHTNVSQSQILHRKTGIVQTAPRQTTVVHSAPSYQVQQSDHSSERVRKGVITSRESTQSRKSSKQNRHCARCGGDATYLCSGCHTEWYCGRECQLKAWDAHSEQCKA